MNLKKLFLMLTFLVLLGTTAFAQTVYVDVTNGSDTYTGVNETNNPAGTGPFASFAKGVSALANGGTLVIKAGTYAEALDFTTGLPAAVTAYTVQLKQLNANNDVAFTGGASVINKTGLTVTIITTVGTEKITQTNAAVNMTLGTINLGSAAAWVLPNGATINLAGTSGFSNAAPSKTTNISLNYTGGSSITAGAESNYGSYGTGTITVNKTAGTTVTFPNAITAVAGIVGTSGNATFSGTVSLGANDITNNGTGTLTFNGAVAFALTDGVAAGNIGSVVNAAGGSVVFNAAATWTTADLTAARVFPAAATTYVVDNQAAGSILFNAGTTFVPDPTTAFFNATVTAINNAGTLTMGTITANTANAVSVIANLVNSTAGGTLNVAGKIDGNLTTGNATATTNITAATTVAGIFTNAGTTALGANVLTLSGNSAHVTVGGTVTATAPGGILVTSTGAGISFNGGTLGNVTNNGAANTVTITAAATFTNLTATAGTVLVGAAITVSNLTLNGGNVTNGNFTITVSNYEQSSGTLTLAANAASILDVKGNFNRTGGTFTAGAASLVSFTGSGAQTVNGGPLFQVSSLTFNNAGGLITVGNSIRSSGAIIIATATNVDFATTNLIMNGGAATSTITNNGTYTAIGGGGVVVGGVNTVTGFLAGGALGATYTMQGTGTYSYITIDVGAGNFAEVVTTVTGVKWNGVLTLRSGTLNVSTAGVDFGPTGSNASIVRYPEDSPGIAVTGGTFNTANVSYDLTYKGAITANRAVGTEITATPANVKTWRIETTGAFLNTLPAGANLTFGGTLYIEDGATLNLPTGAATLFVLSGDSKTHTVRGVISFADGGDALSVTGTSVTINGSATVAHAATIGNFTTSSTNLTIANVQSFAGTFATTGTSVVSLGMGASTLAAADQVIVGAVTLGGTSLTLTTNITSTAGITQNSGTVVLGGNNLLMNGNYNQTAGTLTSTGGYLQFNTAAVLTLANSVAYLRANNVAVTLGSNITVSEVLDIAGALPGTITSAGFNVTIQKNMTTVGGNIFTGGGALTLAGTTVTASGDPNISNLTVNSTGIATLASSVAATARTFTVTTLLTQTTGELAIGANHLALSGAGAVYTRAAGTFTATTGEFRFTGAAAQTAAQGTGFSVPNLTINNTTAGAADVTFAGGATNDFTVTGTLRLTAGSFSSTAAGKLHLGNLATIERFSTVSTLVEIPTFDGDVNISYRGATGATMANEMPTAASGKLNNLLVNMAAVGNTVATAAAVTFKGTLTLTSGILNNTGGTITAASGATIVKNAGTLGQPPTVTNYNLTYTSTQAPTTANEFINGAGISVDLLTINPGAANTVTLHAARSVKDLTITSGTLNNGGFNLTVLGNFNAAGGAYAGGGALVIGGSTAQTFTVPAAGLGLGGNLTINNAAGVTLAGGNLTMNAGTTVTFTSGVLSTGDNWIQFAHSAAAQGFTRTSGHVSGNVRHAITAGAGSPTVYANGRYEFPIGTATQYRPFSITFTSTYPAINPTNVIVSHVDSSPLGVKNLPLDAGNNLKIGNYPNYYWLVKTTPSSFTSTQNFDVDMHATNIGYPYDSDQNLRIIRRQDGNAESNGWVLQGNSSNYSNYQVVTGADTLAVIRTTSSIGGIVNEGTRFTAGVPTRAPIFTAPVVTAYTVAENATLDIQFTADAKDVGETVSYSIVSGPEFATIDATGKVTLAPNYTHGSATAYTLIVRATDSGNQTVNMTVNITVTDVNRAPSFTATGAAVLTDQTVKAGTTLNFTYLAVDADVDALTYTLTPAIAPAFAGTAAITATGVLTLTPVFADAGKVFVVSVQAADGKSGTATTTANVTVSYAGEKGDVDGNGTVASADASQILQHVVGLVLITDPAKVWAADANNDGVIGAIDAAWVLYKFANGSFPTASFVASEVSAEFGKLSKVAKNEAMVNGNQTGTSTFALPISVSNAKQVQSIYAEFALSNDIDFQNIQASLPEGWMIQSKFENGVLKVAMAGISGLANGNVAVINVGLRNVETTGEISGTLTINDNGIQSLEPLKLRAIPTEFGLGQNYPNPFNPTTSIKYQIAENANVSLTVYNMLGQQVKSLITGQQEAGYYTVNWNGTNEYGSKVASGIYIYRLQAGKYIQTLKMNLLK